MCLRASCVFYRLLQRDKWHGDDKSETRRICPIQKSAVSRRAWWERTANAGRGKCLALPVAPRVPDHRRRKRFRIRPCALARTIARDAGAAGVPARRRASDESRRHGTARPLPCALLEDSCCRLLAYKPSRVRSKTTPENREVGAGGSSRALVFEDTGPVLLWGSRDACTESRVGAVAEHPNGQAFVPDEPGR